MIKQKGNIGELMATGICVLAMLTIMMAYMDCAELLERKENVGQIARKYILRMETVGYLTQADCTALTDELEENGVTEIDYTGTTVQPVIYGQPITLKIEGKLGEEHAFVEKRVSTAKN